MEILFEDKQIAVCLKPAGIISQSSDGGNDMIALLNAHFEENGENAKEYEKLYSVIDKAFPNIREKAERLTFGKGCFVYIIKGKNAEKNIMLMSHHDVVEGCEGWESDPFAATIF